jgi:5-methylcytosine-specific restriction endonuclease McrA
LKKLSNEGLLAGLERLRGVEREIQLDILHYLNEIERRRLYVSMAYSSLFEFCTGHMGYSKSSASRRIRAARCINRFPQAAELLLSGELNLSALALISKILTNDNAGKVISQVRGRPVEDVEVIVARYRPGGRIRDRVKPVFVMSPVRAHDAGSAPDDPRIKTGESGKTSECTNNPSGKINTNSSADITTGCKAGFTFTPDIGSEKSPNCKQNFTDLDGEVGVERETEPERVAVEQRFKIEFTVKPEFMKKYNKIKAMLSAKHPDGPGFEDVFNILMEEYLHRHSPESRIEKRNRRKGIKKKRDAGNGKSRRHKKREQVEHNEGSGKKPSVNNPGRKRSRSARSRHIPQEIRDKIFVRDGGRCTFTSPSGRRCSETRNLQIDHVIPFAKDGSNAPENLRLLCFKHNQLMAEREYGPEHMKRFNRRE